MLKEKAMYIKIPNGGYYQRTEIIDKQSIKITYLEILDEKLDSKEVRLSSLPGILCYDVEPHTINQDLFYNYHGPYSDNSSFQLIKEALNELNNNPEKYAKPFYVFIPFRNPKTHGIGTSKIHLSDFIAQAEEDFGGHIVNWVELGIIFAQIISKADSFVPVFAFPDKLGTYYKLFISKNGNAKICGDCKYSYFGYCLAHIHNDEYDEENAINLASPFIAVYK